MYRFTKAKSTPRLPATSHPLRFAESNAPAQPAYQHVLDAADREFAALSAKLELAFDGLRDIVSADPSVLAGLDLTSFENQLTTALTDSYGRVMTEAADGEARQWPALSVMKFSERIESELGHLFQFFNPLHVESGPHGGEFASKGGGMGGGLSISQGGADAVGMSPTGGGGGGTAHPGGPAHDPKQIKDFKGKAAYTKYLIGQGYEVNAIAKHIGDSPYYVKWYKDGPGSTAKAKGGAAKAVPAAKPAATPAPVASAPAPAPVAAKPAHPSEDTKTAADFSSKVAYTKYLIQQGYDHGEIAKHIGKAPYYVKYYEKELASKGQLAAPAASPTTTPAMVPANTPAATPHQTIPPSMLATGKAMQDAYVEFSNNQMTTAKQNPKGNTAKVVVDHLASLGHDSQAIADATGIPLSDVNDHIKSPPSPHTGHPSTAVAADLVAAQTAGTALSSADSAKAAYDALSLKQKQVLAQIPGGYVSKDIITKMYAAGHAPEHIAMATGLDVANVHKHLGTTPTPAAPAITNPAAASLHTAPFSTAQIAEAKSNPTGENAGKIVEHLIAQGHTTQQISDALGIASNHVLNHVVGNYKVAPAAKPGQDTYDKLTSYDKQQIVMHPEGFVAYDTVTKMHDAGVDAATISSVTGLHQDTVNAHINTPKTPGAAPVTPAAPAKSALLAASDTFAKVPNAHLSAAYLNPMGPEAKSIVDLMTSEGHSPQMISQVSGLPLAAINVHAGTTGILPTHPVGSIAEQAAHSVSSNFVTGDIGKALASPAGANAKQIVDHLHGQGYTGIQIQQATGLPLANVMDHINKPVLPAASAGPKLQAAHDYVNSNVTPGAQTFVKSNPDGMMAKAVVNKMAAYGHSPADIATSLGLPEGSVIAHLGKASAVAPPSPNAHALATAAKDYVNNVLLPSAQDHIKANPNSGVTKNVVTNMANSGHAPGDIAVALNIPESAVHSHLGTTSGTTISTPPVVKKTAAQDYVDSKLSPALKAVVASDPTSSFAKTSVEILALQGHSQKDIADALGISEQHVKDHLAKPPTAAEFVTANVHPSALATVKANPESVGVGKLVSEMNHQGHTPAEIAGALGISEAHVNEHLHPGPPKMELASEAHYGKLMPSDTIQYNGSPYTDTHNQFLNQFKGQTGTVVGPATGHGASNHTADSPFGGVAVEFDTPNGKITANVKNIDIEANGSTAEHLKTPAPPKGPFDIPKPTAQSATQSIDAAAALAAAGPEPMLKKVTAKEAKAAASGVTLDPDAHKGKMKKGDEVTANIDAWQLKNHPEYAQYNGMVGHVADDKVTKNQYMMGITFHKGTPDEVTIHLPGQYNVEPAGAFAQKLKEAQAKKQLMAEAQTAYAMEHHAWVVAAHPPGAPGAPIVIHTDAESLPQDISQGVTIDHKGMIPDHLGDSTAKAQIMSKMAGQLAGDPGFTSFANFLVTQSNAYTGYGANNHEKAISMLVGQWASNSGDNTSLSVFMQHMAQEEFGLNEAHVSHLNNGQGYEQKYKGHEAGARAFLRQMYNNTQEELAARGMTEVPLYRGQFITTYTGANDFKHQARLKDALAVKQSNKAARIEMDLQPMNSHSQKYNVSTGFGEHIFKTMVPAYMIISTPLTGYGCLSENEWVVFGGSHMQYRVADTSAGSTALNFVEVGNVTDIDGIPYTYVGYIDGEDGNEWPKRAWDLPAALVDAEGLERFILGGGDTVEHFLSGPLATMNRGKVPALDALFAEYGK